MQEGVRNDASPQGGGGSSVVRLHVGGLGPAVISNDLLQTFSSLVQVFSVEIVRTKGRSFAYVTVQAAPHDVKRLFSLYNGCMWKGGRLKLENAREFYMDKLHREWAECDCPEDLNVPKPDLVTPAKNALKHKESSGLNIYFPKLRKVKKIPEKGLGKHKRSFERVDPLPHSLLRICNCDQDCRATCSFRNLTEKEPLGVAKKEGRQHSKSATIKLMNEAIPESGPSDKNFGNKAKKVLGGKPRDGDERRRLNLLLKIRGTSNAEAENAGDIIDLDEPVLNITRMNQSYIGQDENVEDHELHKEEATQAKVDGAIHAQRKRPKVDLRKENRQHSKIEKGTDQVLQGGETTGSQLSRSSSGRSWVQKASWKALVRGTGPMSFSLGSVLDQNDHFTQQ